MMTKDKIAPKVTVKKSKTGLGIFAAEPIKKGVCVMEYVGNIITNEEAEKKKTSKYLFEINSKYTIDGTVRTNTARYFNHSCKPNCESKIKKGRVFVYTLRAIKKGEEMLYDYGEEYFNEFIKPHGCKCQKCSVV